MWLLAMAITGEVSRSAAALVVHELELYAHGVAPHQIAAATRYAWRRAGGMARRARPALAEAVFVTSLDEALDGAERWVAGNQRAARDGDMARGVDLAVDEGRADRGYSRLGIDGRGAAGKWADAREADKGGYRTFWS